jgi:hypothetical protein
MRRDTASPPFKAHYVVTTLKQPVNILPLAVNKLSMTWCSGTGLYSMGCMATSGDMISRVRSRAVRPAVLGHTEMRDSQ